MCKMYEIKMNNLADVEIFHFAVKKLFRTEFQQYKWKSQSSFLTDKLQPDIFWGDFWHCSFVQRGFVRGLCPRSNVTSMTLFLHKKVFGLLPFTNVGRMYL